MKEFINKWSNWWILNPKRKQLDDAFEKELNELIEREIALRQHNVEGRSEQCNHKFERVERGGEFQGNQCECGEWEDLT